MHIQPTRKSHTPYKNWTTETWRPVAKSAGAALSLAWLFCFTLNGCVTNKASGRRQFILVPSAQMNAMGAQAFDTIKREEKLETSPRIKNYVKCVANAITAEVGGRWEVAVFRSDTVNAFALPGGKIGVYTGLLKVAENQDQLAAVLGHEVAHVLADHGAERVSQNVALGVGLEAVNAAMANSKSKGLILGALGLGAQVGVLLPHSRSHESEADTLGQKYMAKAGFDPSQAAKLWQNMAKLGRGGPEFLSTHPAPSRRIKDLSQSAKSLRSVYLRAKKAGKRPDCKR